MKDLKKFEEILKVYNPSVFNSLLDGLKEVDFKNKVIEIFGENKGLDELYFIYSWKGGTKINFDLPKEFSCIVPNYIFNSLDIVEKIVLEDDFYNFKENKMIPVFSTGDGEYISLFFDEINEKGILKSKLYLCSTNDFEIDNVTSIFDNLEVFFEIGELCYKEKYYYQVNGEFELDFDTYWDICSRKNPKSKYWHRGW